LVRLQTQEEFGDTKRIMRIVNRRTDNTMANRINNDRQTTIEKIKNRVTETPLRTPKVNSDAP